MGGRLPEKISASTFDYLKKWDFPLLRHAVENIKKVEVQIGIFVFTW